MMFTSPTNKGVVACERNSMQVFFELSGDSEENLTWSVLDHSLPYSMHYAVAFTIPNHCVTSQFLSKFEVIKAARPKKAKKNKSSNLQEAVPITSPKPKPSEPDWILNGAISGVIGIWLIVAIAFISYYLCGLHIIISQK